MWNWKWMKGAKDFRVEVMRTHSEEEMMELVEKYFDERT